MVNGVTIPPKRRRSNWKVRRHAPVARRFRAAVALLVALDAWECGHCEKPSPKVTSTQGRVRYVKCGKCGTCGKVIPRPSPPEIQPV